MEFKTLVLTIAPPVFLLAFWTFAGFVLRRLPPERVRGWRLFSAGGFVASWSVLGGEAVLSYGSDGLGMQYSKSVWGQMFGAGVKACVQQVHGCSPSSRK